MFLARNTSVNKSVYLEVFISWNSTRRHIFVSQHVSVLSNNIVMITSHGKSAPSTQTAPVTLTYYPNYATPGPNLSTTSSNNNIHG